MLKKYESMIIIVPTLTEDDSKQELEKISSFIKKNGGEVINTDDLGKKRLAFKINDFNEGYYFVNYFNFDTAKVSELERMYKLNENVIRYNIQTK
ncbi:MAG: 30S ribosomal protein S6 [Candidatus Cloacimonetes bacterium]|nr:30S ribosomal protein S6 [Candidatus Cloacimonadota bacterium]MBL7148779.1 30S ribosomal protein S6 [Candidatus Cloacimonadota bacterium]